MSLVDTRVDAVVDVIGNGHFAGAVEAPPQTVVERDLVTRFVDVTTATLVLMVFAIPLAFVALAIAATSRGPVLFRQERVGRGGDSFPVMKFRTMRTGTDAQLRDDDSQWDEYRSNDFKLSSSDPRITRVGRVLRRTSIDEIPQMVNVLRGEMSLVGVRPLLRDEYDERPAYDRLLYRQRRPGLTGRWQVEGRSTVGSVDRWRLDRSYIEEWSLRSDIEILLRTPAAICRTGETA